MISSAPVSSSQSTFTSTQPTDTSAVHVHPTLIVFSTDFRQFEQYLNVTGLDVSLTLHSPLDVRRLTMYRWPLLGIAIYTTCVKFVFVHSLHTMHLTMLHRI